MGALNQDGAKPPYRWYAFTHSLNLAFLLGAGVAGAVVDPLIWLLAAPLELGALWVIPDLPNFRNKIDAQLKTNAFRRERAYCLDQLWGVVRKPIGIGQRILSVFAEVEEGDPVVRAPAHDESFNQYSEMKQIIAKLAELEKVRGVRIVSHEINRFEQVINGYLRYLIACRSLAEALRNVDTRRISAEIAEITEQLKDASADLRPVLLERKRLRETQRERAPKLQATLELFRTRAESIVYQMRNIYGQVLADPGVDVNSFLEDMMEKHDLMADPLSDLEADQAVRELLHNPEAERQRQRGAGVSQAVRGSRQS